MNERETPKQLTAADIAAAFADVVEKKVEPLRIFLPCPAIPFPSLSSPPLLTSLSLQAPDKTDHMMLTVSADAKENPKTIADRLLAAEVCARIPWCGCGMLGCGPVGLTVCPLGCLPGRDGPTPGGGRSAESDAEGG
jgi:hypothetical protein